MPCPTVNCVSGIVEVSFNRLPCVAKSRFLSKYSKRPRPPPFAPFNLLRYARHRARWAMSSSVLDVSRAASTDSPHFCGLPRRCLRAGNEISPIQRNLLYSIPAICHQLMKARNLLIGWAWIRNWRLNSLLVKTEGSHIPAGWDSIFIHSGV